MTRAAEPCSLASCRAHDGSPIWYGQAGTGPSLMVFANPKAPRGPLGIPSRRLCEALVEALADRYRLVLVGYPGQAKPDTLTADNVTRDLLAVADAAGIDDFAWWGYSWGAAIGLQLAAHSDRVSALVCGGFPPIRGPYREMLQLAQHYADRAQRLPLVGLSAPGGVRRSLQQWVTYYSELRDFDDLLVQRSLPARKLCFAGSADKVKLAGTPLADIGGGLVSHRAELVAAGWDVEVLEGLNHRQAMTPARMLPVVVPWLDRALLS